MPKKCFYVDSCIWLNLFKKEGDPTKGVPYWKITIDFVEKVNQFCCVIFVSTIVLKEITFKLETKFDLVNGFFREKDYIKVVGVIPSDYPLAREIEARENFRIGFYDCLHIVIAKRLGATLVTRDRDLISIGRKYIQVCKPEDLIG